MTREEYQNKYGVLPTSSPIKMTKVQYQTKYGILPQATTKISDTPIKMTRAEYESKYKEEPKLSFLQTIGRGFERFKESVSQRGAKIAEELVEKQPPGQKLTRVAGETARHFTDIFTGVVGGVLETGFKKLRPEAQQDLREAGQAFKEGRVGQDIMKQINSFNSWMTTLEENDPEAAQTVKDKLAVGEVVLDFVGAGAGKKVGKEVLGETLETGVRVGVRAGEVAAETVGDVAQTQLTKQITKETLDIVQPTPKSLSKAERQSRIDTGLGEQTSITGKRILQPSPDDIRIAEGVKDIVKKGNTPFDNIDAINKEIVIRSKNLDDNLSKIDWEFDRNLVKNALEETKDKSKVIFGGDKTLENAYNSISGEFSRIFAKQPNTLAGLMQARRDFDTFIKQKFPNIFNKLGGDNVRSNAVMDIRGAVNDFVAKNAPEGIIGVDVLDELSLTSDLFKARTNIRNNVISSLDTNRLQRVVKKLTGGFTGTLLLGGSLTVGVLTGILSSPIVLSALIMGGTYKIGKNIITSKMLKEALIGLSKKLSGKKTSIIKEEADLLDSLILRLEAPSSIRLGAEVKEVGESSVKAITPEKGLIGIDPKTKKFFGTLLSN